MPAADVEAVVRGFSVALTVACSGGRKDTGLGGSTSVVKTAFGWSADDDNDMPSGGR